MIRLEEAALAVMQGHAAEEYPDECCGALVGRSERGTRVVNEAWPLPNATADSRQHRFAVSPADYRQVESRAAARGFALIGFYHSHPDGADEPSKFDLLQAWPNLDYVIVSVVGDKSGGITGWRLLDDRSAFSREEISWPPEF